jgi:hypothetical protein
MTVRASQNSVGATIIFAIAVIVLDATPAKAQWGMGLGWGFGLFRPVPAPIEYLNSKSLVDAARGYQGPTRTPYAGSSNAYFNHVRDNGFVERYNVARREPSYYRYVPTSANVAVPPTPTPAAPEKPMLPLSSFYDAQGQLAWPADSPTAGDLKEKRSAFDQASRLVLDESKKSGVASIAATTEARQKLVEYGRPALEFVRAHETARLADTFHLFLLSLYESLAQAANLPHAATGGEPPPAPHSS